MKPKPIRLFTCVWGSYLDLFEKALVKSLSWPLNKAALQGAKWEIWTKEVDFGPVVDIAKAVGIDVELYAMDDYLKDLPGIYYGDGGVMMAKIFCQAIERCISKDASMLLTPPDTLFGGETVENILTIGRMPGSVVFVAHPRVNPTILDDLENATSANRFGPSSSLSNQGLYKAFLRHAHKTWTEAEYHPSIERTNSYVGGISWQRLANGAVSVSHKLPTPYLINWTKEDLDHFSKETPGKYPPVFGEIDHTWPGALVANTGRARLVGSSQSCFIVEVTDADKNIPPLQPVNHLDPAHFWRNALHNHIFGQTSIIFGGD